MQIGARTYGLGALIALAVGVIALIFLVTGTPAHVFTWIFGLILALAVAWLIP